MTPETVPQVVEAMKVKRILRSFWSPCGKYLVTALVIGNEIVLSDDNGDVWEPGGDVTDVDELMAVTDRLASALGVET